MKAWRVGQSHPHSHSGFERTVVLARREVRGEPDPVRVVDAPRVGRRPGAHSHPLKGVDFE
ncbi:hypothetical protein FJV41_06605 [Myxococcus llanfairpwllgwyngyllgogerychwyrndrobwllllantysiliogogogochensis]|uniref:Uncharacterized protein n=1 Tax=Myxococcus llanfairpwllgwyngyllgogerychwyrndrobwllllantysiliogogogochensis TaxID=2590453 RepID=A0A540X6M8_9BACT|nr:MULTISPECIES: hypothetical protein [Myxococcus]NTX52978.1 hypothetical protein [Myxococcus sp. CA039A]TQF16819.1 hypothetical protein FJV41_06605 [Myxococcus llanfairpwllgwyngyllgogerychwyrndrobwllllantysiliogogogochensis]